MSSDFSSADPPRNFSLSVGERIRALTIGVPAYSARKKSIEDLDEKWVRTLVALHDQLAGRGLDADEIAGRLLEKAATFELKKINTLVETHNRYYPIEANLRIDPRTGDYLIHGRPWTPEESWTPVRLVERTRVVIRARDER